MQDSNHAESTLMQVLYDEHAAALWRYAVRLTGDRARAGDVVQETWCAPGNTRGHQRRRPARSGVAVHRGAQHDH